MPLKLFLRGATYYLRGNVAGQDIYETTGTNQKAFAEAIRIKRENDILTASVFGAASVATFDDAALGYLQNGGEARFLGVYDEETDTWDGLIGYFKGKRLANIGQTDLDAACKALYPNAKPGTQNRQCYTPFVAVWNYGVSAKMCPAHLWRRPSGKLGKRERWARLDEVELLLQHAAPHLRPLITFLAYTLARPAEALALEWKDIYLEERWIVLTDPSRGGLKRGVGLHERVIAALKEIKGPRTGRVFKTHKSLAYPLPKNSGGQCKTGWMSACRRAGLAKLDPTDTHKKKLIWGEDEPLIPYSLRHGGATWLSFAGIGKEIRDRIMGHSESSMDSIYVHVPNQEIIDAIDELPWLCDGSPASQKLFRKCNMRGEGVPVPASENAT